MIEVNHLSKSFGLNTVVDDLSFNVSEGEVLGFLGPNGAGKSTTMKMITGFLLPTTGSVTVCNYDVQADSLNVKRLIGYLPEGAPSYDDMTCYGFLKFIAKIRGFNGAELKKQVHRVIDQVDLSSVVNQKIETLSKGYKRRVGLAQAIVHDPKVLLLDEPTDGLDPNQKHQVRELIGNLAKDKIVIISTHILEEVSAVCSRNIIIHEGRLIIDETPDELMARSEYRHAVSFVCEEFDRFQDSLSKIDGVARVEYEKQGRLVTLVPVGGHDIYSNVNSVIDKQNIPFEQLFVERGRLDEVFRKVTKAKAF